MLSTVEISPLFQFKLKDSGSYILPAIVLGSLLYGAGLVFYRLYLHPLHKIPGPKIAAATYWFEFYQDVILDGHYLEDYPKLHAKYGFEGPVVRVTPNRVHVSEPEFYDEIYNRKSAYLKEEKWTSSGGVSESLPMLIDPDIHHKRRKLVNPIFSPKYIELVAPLALQIIKNALSKAVESHQNSTPLHIQRLYMGITGDVIMQVCFDNQLHLIESTEEDHPVVRGMYFFEDGFFLTQHFPILINAMEYLPTGVANMLLPGYTHFRKQCAQWIEDVRERHHNGALYAKDGRKILFDLLLRPSESEDPSDLPPLTSQVLIDEANAFCLAGTLTTSVSLSLGTYFLLRDPLRRQKLLDELKDVPRNVEGLMEYRDVSKLPYLTACIKETLRISSPIPGVLPRRVPAQGVNCCGHYLASGRKTLISMSARMIHENKKVFPEPEKFIPERWTGLDAKGIDRWLVAFGKGSRACVGMNLAWMEMYLVFSNFFARLDMSLWKTDDYTTQMRDNGGTVLREKVKVMVDGLK